MTNKQSRRGYMWWLAVYKDYQFYAQDVGDGHCLVFQGSPDNYTERSLGMTPVGDALELVGRRIAAIKSGGA